MFNNARSAAAIFGGTVRVRADGKMDYSLVRDSLIARTRMLQGRPELQFSTDRRKLSQVAQEAAAFIERDPEGAQEIIDRVVDAFEQRRPMVVPSDKELAVLYMEAQFAEANASLRR